MEIDWVEAWRIAGIGFGLVFVILTGLAVVTWLLKFVLNRNNGDDEAEKKK